MAFNSYLYLLLLIPAVGLFWMLTPVLRRWYVLALSVAYYATWNAGFVAVPLALCCGVHLIARYIMRRPERMSRMFRAGIAFTLAIFLFFKYRQFLIGNLNGILGLAGAHPVEAALRIGIPLGISFYSFEVISYLIDVRQGRVQQSRFSDLYLFVMFWPHLMAGPIVRFRELAPQLSFQKAFDRTLLIRGLDRLAWGVIQKNLVANRLGAWVDQGFSSAAIPGHTTPDNWLLAVAFGLQIYFDFAAYTNMAIGVARLIGIELPENFRYPYHAQTPPEFWSRWHMTLSRWIRDYLFFPINARYKGAPGPLYASLLGIMALVGLWHGAGWGFVLWGFLHGVYLVLYRVWESFRAPGSGAPRGMWRWGWRAFTIVAVAAAWVPFRAASGGDAVHMLSSMFWQFHPGLTLPAGFYLTTLALVAFCAIEPRLGGVFSKAEAWLAAGTVSAEPLPDASEELHRIMAALTLGMGLALAVSMAMLSATGLAAFTGVWLLCGAALAALVMSRSGGVSVLLSVWLIGVGLYGGEAALYTAASYSQHKAESAKTNYAHAHGVVNDTRNPAEYILALRAQGVNAYPSPDPGDLVHFKSSSGPAQTVLRGSDGGAFYPLSGIANVPTVFGNDLGPYNVYESDEYGFNNPRGSWSLPRYDVAFVGDSFTVGTVPREKNLTAAVRREFPGTVNLSRGGLGPLAELGLIREYLQQRRPGTVVWVFCEANDLRADLVREKRIPVLMNYLDDPPRLQNLEARRSEADAALRTLMDSLLSPESVELNSAKHPGLDWLSLHRTTLTARQLSRKIQVRMDDIDYPLFEKTLAAARDLVRSWGGQFVFVYPPMTFREAALIAKPRAHSEDRRNVLEICRRLDIPVIDVERRFADAESNRLDEYFLPYPGHYTPAGFQRVGELILEELRFRNLLPPPAAGATPALRPAERYPLSRRWSRSLRVGDRPEGWKRTGGSQAER